MRHYNSDRPDAIPIVLIARSQWHAQLADTVEEDIGDALPFQHPAVETDPFYIPQGEKRAYGMGNEPGKHEHPNFTRLSNWCLKNEEESAVGLASLVLKPLIPLLYLSMFWIRDPSVVITISCGGLGIQSPISMRLRHLSSTLVCPETDFDCGQWWKIRKIVSIIF